MGLDPEILQQLISTFKHELDERIQIITSGLLELEKGKNNEHREEVILTIFRAAHNIKGTSNSLGISNVSTIAHHIESIFSSIQKKTITIRSQLIDLCFESIDKMKSAMQSFIENKELHFDLQDLITRLNQEQTIKNEDKNLISTSEPIKNQQYKPEQPIIEKNKNHSVRVSIDNIDHISSLMEEMQVNKIAIDDHYSELVKLTIKSKQLSEIWSQISYFMKNHFPKEIGDNLQKLYYTGEDCLTEITNSSSLMHKNIRLRINELSILSTSLQDEIRLLRLIPVSNFLCTMPRYIRDLSRELNKKVELNIKDDDVKIDKMILERIKDPIIHLLRNCIDHGIESADVRQASGKPEVGQINIDIREENNQIYITISDDGAGIDIKKIAEIAESKNFISKSELNNINENEILELIFRPGFSTKEIITDISGRGVGLDIVKTNIGNLNGHITVKTELGKSTTFDLRLPLTLSSEHGLMISCCGQLFVIPTSSVQRVLIIGVDDIFEVEGNQAIMLDKHPIPLRTLADILDLEQKEINTQNQLSIIVIKKGWNSFAILVDKIIGEREIVIKPLQKPLTTVPFISGGTLTGSNQVIMVLNPSDLINAALSNAKNRRISIRDNTNKNSSKQHILVVDDSITTRSLEKNILESKNYQVTVSVNGKEAWDILQKQQFSLLITDITMPVMDGFTLTSLVKKSDKLRNLPVIIVTSLGSDEEKKRGIEVGADAYIIKNEFESSKLLEIVEQLV